MDFDHGSSSMPALLPGDFADPAAHRKAQGCLNSFRFGKKQLVTLGLHVEPPDVISQVESALAAEIDTYGWARPDWLLKTHRNEHPTKLTIAKQHVERKIRWMEIMGPSLEEFMASALQDWHYAVRHGLSLSEKTAIVSEHKTLEMINTARQRRCLNLKRLVVQKIHARLTLLEEYDFPFELSSDIVDQKVAEMNSLKNTLLELEQHTNGCNHLAPSDDSLLISNFKYLGSGIDSLDIIITEWFKCHAKLSNRRVMFEEVAKLIVTNEKSLSDKEMEPEDVVLLATKIEYDLNQELKSAHLKLAKLGWLDQAIACCHQLGTDELSNDSLKILQSLEESDGLENGEEKDKLMELVGQLDPACDSADLARLLDANRDNVVSERQANHDLVIPQCIEKAPQGQLMVVEDDHADDDVGYDFGLDDDQLNNANGSDVLCQVNMADSSNEVLAEDLMNLAEVNENAEEEPDIDNAENEDSSNKLASGKDYIPGLNLDRPDESRDYSEFTSSDVGANDHVEVQSSKIVAFGMVQVKKEEFDDTDLNAEPPAIPSVSHPIKLEPVINTVISLAPTEKKNFEIIIPSADTSEAGDLEAVEPKHNPDSDMISVQSSKQLKYNKNSQFNATKENLMDESSDVDGESKAPKRSAEKLEITEDGASDAKEPKLEYLPDNAI